MGRSATVKPFTKQNNQSWGRVSRSLKFNLMTEKMQVIINIQFMHNKVYDEQLSFTNLMRYKIEILREMQYELIDKWNAAVKKENQLQTQK